MGHHNISTLLHQIILTIDINKIHLWCCTHTKFLCYKGSISICWCYINIPTNAHGSHVTCTSDSWPWDSHIWPSDVSSLLIWCLIHYFLYMLWP